ncbi:hypothetical protein Tco_0528946 [Tanacetum coccineum]
MSTFSFQFARSFAVVCRDILGPRNVVVTGRSPIYALEQNKGASRISSLSASASTRVPIPIEINNGPIIGLQRRSSQTWTSIQLMPQAFHKPTVKIYDHHTNIGSQYADSLPTPGQFKVDPTIATPPLKFVINTTAFAITHPGSLNPGYSKTITHSNPE